MVIACLVGLLKPRSGTAVWDVWICLHYSLTRCSVCFLPGGGVSVVGGVVQLVLMFPELWRRSEEPGEALSHTEVTWNFLMMSCFLNSLVSNTCSVSGSLHSWRSAEAQPWHYIEIPNWRGSQDGVSCVSWGSESHWKQPDIPQDKPDDADLLTCIILLICTMKRPENVL